MTPSLLKDHLRVDLPDAQQGDPLGLDLEGGQGTLQPGEFALLIAQGIALRSIRIQPPLGDQLDGLVLHILIGLLALNGNNHVVFHTPEYLKSSGLQIANYYTQIL